MIWLYIFAAIMAEAIVVVLLLEFINRRSPASDPPKAASSDPQPEALPKDTTAVVEERSVVGQTTFTREEFEAMRDEIRGLKACIETFIEMKDVEFDKTTEEKENKVVDEAPDARMSRDAEAKAWEDHRDEEEQIDKEDNSVAPPNPLATGADFDDLTKATVIMETADGRTPEDLQFAMNIYHTVEGTQFSGCLPDALLEKLQECTGVRSFVLRMPKMKSTRHNRPRLLPRLWRKCHSPQRRRNRLRRLRTRLSLPTKDSLMISSIVNLQTTEWK